jgi:hypothetical protein
MAKRDAYHDTVRTALEKDGWIVTHDPLTLQFGDRNVYVDLGAEAPMAAEKAGRKIAVEVKSFLGVSDITELERALGQYLLYSFLLQEREPGRSLFLALPDRAYNIMFDTAAGQKLIAFQHLRLLVFNVDEEQLVQWIEPSIPS